MSISLIILLWACSLVAFLYFGIAKGDLKELTVAELLLVIAICPLTFPTLLLRVLVGVWNLLAEHFLKKIVWRRNGR